MSSKIQSVTIVNQQGTRAYCVGVEYNGLLLDQIQDRSVEFPDSITIIYAGLTKDNDLVFEAINAPIDVQYELYNNSLHQMRTRQRQ